VFWLRTAEQLAMMKGVLLCFSAGFGLAAATTELTDKTFASAIDGKNAFVKFLAPW